jgi:uncharacterized protein involved in exopolysaccharide biosynthesis
VPDPQTPGGDTATPWTPLTIVNTILEARRSVLRWAFGGAFLSVLLAFVLGRSWTVEFSFTPAASSEAGGGLAGLAAQFGVALPVGDADQSPDFYVALLKSRRILTEVATKQYEFRAQAGPPFFKEEKHFSGNLADLYEIEDDDPAVRLALAIERLEDDVAASASLETGIVTVRVVAPWPELAEAIGQALLDHVAGFNTTARSTQAGAERQFVESRLQEAERELRAAEDRLQAFLAGNQQFRASSQLAFQEDRLRREVGMRQQVYTGLQQALEQARIEEVRNTPVITVIDPADRPARPDRRRLGLKLVLGCFLGAGLAALAALWRELLRSAARAPSSELARFLGQLQELSLLGLWRRRRQSPT